MRSAADARRRLRAHAVPAQVAILQRFFKTGPGQYGAGDRFIGVKVPGVRAVCRDCHGLPLTEIRTLLRSPIHEERLLALLVLVEAFARGDAAQRRRIYDFYLRHTAFINNWDLVDASAAQIVGVWLRDRSKSPLAALARSPSLWQRRIAIIATFDYIRNGRLDETFRIADILLRDEHDLIHKAVGWMLREAGKRDGAAVRRFLAARYAIMPRTMLRYAIERFPESERKRYLAGQVPASSVATTSTRAAGVSMKSSRPSKSPSAKR
ncbi:MAG TPA: DNA alkylation repair protein [Vicinamibacterales bacterium]|nr:DNA alkylation repair protein [Vicinamibacterales bacterium]